MTKEEPLIPQDAHPSRCTYCLAEIEEVTDSDDYLWYVCQDCSFECPDCSKQNSQRIPNELGNQCRYCSTFLCPRDYQPHAMQCQTMYTLDLISYMGLWRDVGIDRYHNIVMIDREDINGKVNYVAIGGGNLNNSKTTPLTPIQLEKCRRLNIELDDRWQKAGPTGENTNIYLYLEKYPTKYYVACSKCPNEIIERSLAMKCEICQKYNCFKQHIPDYICCSDVPGEQIVKLEVDVYLEMEHIKGALYRDKKKGGIFFHQDGEITKVIGCDPKNQGLILPLNPELVRHYQSMGALIYESWRGSNKEPIEAKMAIKNI